MKVLLDERFERGKAYPCEVIKTELQSIYDSLGLQRTAKATDLGHWYDIQDKTYRQNGKNVSCKLIIRDKVKVLKESGK